MVMSAHTRIAANRRPSDSLSTPSTPTDHATSCGGCALALCCAAARCT